VSYKKTLVTAAITCIAINNLAFASYVASNSQNVSDSPQERVQIFEGSQYGFHYPTGIAIDANGDAWVTNEGNRITKIPAADPLHPSVYSGPEYNFSRPGHPTLDAARNLWVSNTNNTVTKIPIDTPIYPTSYHGSEFNFNYPGGIAVDAKGDAWVVNQGANGFKHFHVTKIPANYPQTAPIIYEGSKFLLNSELYDVTTDVNGNAWVTSGYGKAVIKIPANYPKEKPVSYPIPVRFPVAITIDTKGNVWIVGELGASDDSNMVVKLPADNPKKPVVFSDEKYKFYDPNAITSDAEGNIWVANGRTSSATGRGNSVTKIPADHPENPIVYDDPRFKFNYPVGIAVDKKGNVWIANAMGNSVTNIIVDSSNMK